MTKKEILYSLEEINEWVAEVDNDLKTSWEALQNLVVELSKLKKEIVIDLIGEDDVEDEGYEDEETEEDENEEIEEDEDEENEKDEDTLDDEDEVNAEWEREDE